MPTLLDINDAKLLLSGIYKNVPAMRIPLWADGENVEFVGLGPRKSRGWAEAFANTGTVPVRGMAQSLIGTTKTLTFGDQSKLWLWNSSTLSQVGSGYTGNLNQSGSTLASTWSIVPFGSWFLATNGKDVPQVYKGTSYAALAGVDFTTAEIFMKYGPHVLALNTSNGANKVQWSDEDDPEYWTIGAGHEAGALSIRDMESPIIAAAYLGDNIAAYGADSMSFINYIKSPNYFGFRRGLANIGAVSKQSVVELDRKNFGLGRMGFWATDGASVQRIDSPAVQKWLDSRMNWAQASKVCAYYDDDAKLIKWHLPYDSGNEPGCGWGYSPQLGSWTFLNYGRTSGLDRNVFDYMLTADDAGNVYNQGYGYDAAGAAQTCFIQTKPMDLGNPEAQMDPAEFWKFVDRLQASCVDIAGTVYGYVGFQETMDDAITWKGPFTLDDGFEMNAFDGLEGVFISVKFVWSGLASAGEIGRFKLHGALTGAVS